MGCSKKKLCLVDAGQNNKSDAGRCSLVHEHLYGRIWMASGIKGMVHVDNLTFVIRTGNIQHI